MFTNEKYIDIKFFKDDGFGNLEERKWMGVWLPISMLGRLSNLVFPGSIRSDDNKQKPNIKHE